MSRWRAAAAGGLAAATLLSACATTLEREAREALVEGIDPAPLVRTLAARHAAIDGTKRIFDVTLIEGRRRFSGAGALEYRADPRRLDVDVFGPHDTPVVRIRLVGDSLTVVLPQEGEVLTGSVGDPRFAALAGERAFAAPEILGALLGAYDVQALVEGARGTAAADDGARRTLYVLADGAVHALTVEGEMDRLVEYRQGRDGRLVYRVRFSDHRRVGGRESPHRVVLRDYTRERQLVVDVTLERPLDPAPGR